MGDSKKIKTIDMGNGQSYRSLRAGNHKEIARSGIFATGAAAAVAGAALASKAKPKAVKPKTYSFRGFPINSKAR